MTNRIDEKFAARKVENRSAFIVYITGGDPSLDKTIEIASTLERAGADVLEIGVPFSDPLADGVANQLGAQRALQAGATLPRLLYTISQIRTQVSVPIVLYSYLNPIFQYGFPQFEEDALAAGVDGVLLLDLPPEEDIDADHPHLIHRIRLIAPTTPEERIRSITGQASGFVYYVSREGVTGERDDLASSIPERIGQIRNHTSLPSWWASVSPVRPKPLRLLLGRMVLWSAALLSAKSASWVMSQLCLRNYSILWPQLPAPFIPLA